MRLYVLTLFRGACTSWTRSEAGLKPPGKLTVHVTVETATGALRAHLRFSSQDSGRVSAALLTDT